MFFRTPICINPNHMQYSYKECRIQPLIRLVWLRLFILRELSFSTWLVCRMFEVQDLRKLFHPDYFAGETPEEAMERRAKADRLVAMGSRVYQHDMAEVQQIRGDDCDS